MFVSFSFGILAWGISGMCARSGWSDTCRSCHMGHMWKLNIFTCDGNEMVIYDDGAPQFRANQPISPHAVFCSCLFLGGGGVAHNWLGLPLVGVEERFTEETICFAQALLQVVTTWR